MIKEVMNIDRGSGTTRGNGIHYFTYRPLFLVAFFFLPLSFFCFRLPPLHAAFQEPYWSARVASLGGAFTAMSGDPSVILYNSAAAVGVKKKQANFSHARLFHGVDGVKVSLYEFAYVQPWGKAAFGIGWGNFTSASLYREDTAVVGFSRSFKNALQDLCKEFSVGVSVRYLTRRFVLDEKTSADPVFREGNRKQSATFDLHLYAVPEEDLLPGVSFGVSLKSINQSDVGFADTERLPREVVGGLLYKWKNIAFPIDIFNRSGEIGARFGGEMFLFNERVAARAGSDLSQLCGGFGYEHIFSDQFSIILDYAFLWPLKVEGTQGSHRATLGVKF